MGYLWWRHDLLQGYQYHGGPSEAGDCSHPPLKMATVENPTSGKDIFDNVLGRKNECHQSSLVVWFLIVLDFLYSSGKTYSSFLNICNMWYEKIHIVLFFLNRSYRCEPMLAKMDFWLKTKSQIDAGPGYRDSSTKYQIGLRSQLAPFIRDN